MIYGGKRKYAGRLHRLHHAKKQVMIYDYVDTAIPMLAKMAEKRMKGYERLGYALCRSTERSEESTACADRKGVK